MKNTKILLFIVLFLLVAGAVPAIIYFFRIDGISQTNFSERILKSDDQKAEPIDNTLTIPDDSLLVDQGQDDEKSLAAEQIVEPPQAVPEKNIDSNGQVKKTPLDKPVDLNIIGTISSFTFNQGFQSFKEHMNKIDSLELYIYELTGDGTISLVSGVNEDQEQILVDLARANNVAVYFGIENDEDEDRVELLYQDETIRNFNFEQIIGTLSDKKYDGVVIDYEGLSDHHAHDFVTYIKDLSLVVRQQGKKLNISANTDQFRDIYHGIDLAAVAPYIDILSFNAYEEYSDYTGPGPVASIRWVENIIKNVIALNIPPSKIVLGTIFAGHDWIVSKPEEFYNDSTAYEALLLAEETNALLKWNSEFQSNFFEYEDNRGRQHEVWIEDKNSIQEKINLAQRYNLNGLFFWYLGGEDRKIWNIL